MHCTVAIYCKNDSLSSQGELFIRFCPLLFLFFFLKEHG
uniref:Uncharacterized protein n=1 Tax=Anguilla anguilla TaxID=7936 RepID=A0A0E9U6H9_ANGAN